MIRKIINKYHSDGSIKEDWYKVAGAIGYYVQLDGIMARKTTIPDRYTVGILEDGKNKSKALVSLLEPYFFCTIFC